METKRLTTDETLDRLRCSRSWLYHLARTGLLPACRRAGGRRLLFDEAVVEAFLQRRPAQAQAARPATAAGTPKAVCTIHPNSTPPSADLTLCQAAAALGCEPALLEQAVRRGLLSARREGGELWLRRAEVEALAEGDGGPGADPGGRGPPAHPRPSS